MNKFIQHKVYQGLKPIKSVLSKDVRKIINSQKNSFDDVKSKWSDIVGTEISSISVPEKIKQSSINSDKTLFLSVPKEHIIEIDYSRDYIIEKLNSYFGYQFINKVIINSYKISKLKNDTVNKAPTLNESLSNKIKLIKNESLKNAFKNFFKNEDK
jgi:hypothetical protein